MARTKKQHRHRSDIEIGTYHMMEKQSSDGPEAPNDSDGNDKFWKLFLEEAKSEAQYKVDIWKTELDNLLVFAGLFAGILSSFLLDLQSRLNSTAVNAAGPLWYGSLVVTLVGALWAVLAQRWIGEFLREIHENPDHQALERWKRDIAAQEWYMEAVITGIPILTQIALAMFLIGFVFQTLDNDHAIGIEVGTLVGLGALAYAVITLLPCFYPDCPYQTPIYKFVRATVRTITPAIARVRAFVPKKNVPETEIKKIQILISRLNHSSNDEIFSAAASTLDDKMASVSDGKLDSTASPSWYKLVQGKAPDIAEAVFVRLTSFTHQVQKIKEEPSVPILKDTAVEYGIICLRLFFRSIEASIPKDRSRWIKHDIGHIWKTKALPPAWRLLSWSTDITKRLTNDNGTDSPDMNTDMKTAIDYDMIHKTFSDLNLRSIVGLSACRGLLQGRGTLKRVCALGLAMFVEVDAITSTTSESPTQNSDEKVSESDSATMAAKIIIELWSELVKIWKDAMVRLLGQTRGEGNEKDSLIELLGDKLYQREMKGLVSGAIVKQLENTSSVTQKEAMQMLTKLSEYTVYQEAVKNNGAIVKVVRKLENEDVNIRAAAFTALQEFGKHALYHSDIISSISIIVQRLRNESQAISRQTIEALMELFKLYLRTPAVPFAQPPTGVPPDQPPAAPSTQQIYRSAPNPADSPSLFSKLFEELWDTLRSKGIIRGLVARLVDPNPDVRSAAEAALKTFSAHEPYQSDIKSSIPTIITHLDDRTTGSGSYIRAQTAQILKWLCDHEVFRRTLQSEGAISQLGAKLVEERTNKTGQKVQGDHVVVRSSVIDALLAFAEHPLYQADITSSIPIVIKGLDDPYWKIRAKAVQILAKFSEFELKFRQTSDMPKIFSLLVSKFEDNDKEICDAVVAALRAYCTNELYQHDIKSCIPAIIKQLNVKQLGDKQMTYDNWVTRTYAARMLATLSEHDVYHEPISNSRVIIEIIAKLKDNDRDVRAAAIQALSVLSIQRYFQETIISENAITQLFDKLTDDVDFVRSAAIQAISTLYTHEVYRNNITSSIFTSVTHVVKQLQDKSWSTRQHAVQLLTEFATSVVFRPTMSNEKIDSILVNVLVRDSDENVRIAAAQTLSEFGKEEMFQNASKSSVILIITSKLADTSPSVRIAVQSTLLALSKQESYQDDIKSAIPDIMKHLEDQDGIAQQQAIQMLLELSARPVFHETLKTEGLIAKLVTKLDDNVMEDVRTTAIEALSTFGINGLFKELLNENVIPILISKLLSSGGRVHSSVHDALLVLGTGATDFLSPIVSTLGSMDELPSRTEVYKILIKLKGTTSDLLSFLNETDAAICELFWKMKDKDLSNVHLSTTILAEITKQDLIGGALKLPTAFNSRARDALENVVRTKLVYNKNSPDRKDILLTLSRLANNGAFRGCLKSAIPGLIVTVSEDNSSDWSIAAGAISALSREEEFRVDLVPAIQKFIRQLNEWNEDEERSVDLIEAMSTIAEYKEFQMKLRHVVPQLMKRLLNRPKDVQDKTKVAFYKAACKLISKLCRAEATDMAPVGRDLVPQLTHVLSNVGVSLINELLDLVGNLSTHGNLTINDCIALASSLRIGSSVSEAFEVKLGKLKMAALLDAAHARALVALSPPSPEYSSLDARTPEVSPSSEYSSFLDAILGKGNDTVRSKLTEVVALLPALPPTSQLSQAVVQVRPKEN